MERWKTKVASLETISEQGQSHQKTVPAAATTATVVLQAFLCPSPQEQHFPALPFYASPVLLDGPKFHAAALHWCDFLQWPP